MSENKKEKTSPTSWGSTLIDAADGSGDLIVELPQDLMDQAGWVLGDVLDMSLGEQGKLIIRKKT